MRALGSSALSAPTTGGITIKIIIVPEVASHARSESAEGKKGEGNRTNVKETICRFQRTAWSYVNARVLVLIAAVNASNFTRLISLSLAESSVRSRRMNETGRKRREKKRKRKGKEGRNSRRGRREKEEIEGDEQRDDNSMIQIRDLSEGLRSLPSDHSLFLSLSRALSSAPLSAVGRSARRLIKFSSNQICHSAVRF